LLASLSIEGPGYDEFITSLTQIAYAVLAEQSNK
jgi:hypothetical protein